MAISLKESRACVEMAKVLYGFLPGSGASRAGLDLEKVLNGLFDLAGLMPRSAFRVIGEQIDGSFELDAETYLVEAKWEGMPLSEAPLLVFRGKIEGKSQFTRGVFVSISGFTPACLQSIVKGKQPSFLLVDGYDLATVLEGRFDLAVLLRSKLRLLNEEGRPYVSAKELS